MKKFFALFRIPTAVIDNWRATTPPEEMKKAGDEMMQKWGEWMQANAKSILDPGGPLGKTKRVTSAGAADARNDLTGYVILSAQSPEAAAKLFTGHPHLMIPESSVEIMEIPPMTGH